MEVHGGRTHSAVLVPLFADPTGALHAVFTRRRADLRRHAGENMPPKSTYFYPKVLTGMLFNPLED
jgi:hypothetical protein